MRKNTENRVRGHTNIFSYTVDIHLQKGQKTYL